MTKQAMQRKIADLLLEETAEECFPGDGNAKCSTCRQRQLFGCDWYRHAQDKAEKILELLKKIEEKTRPR